MRIRTTTKKCTSQDLEEVDHNLRHHEDHLVEVEIRMLFPWDRHLRLLWELLDNYKMQPLVVEFRWE